MLKVRFVGGGRSWWIHRSWPSLYIKSYFSKNLHVIFLESNLKSVHSFWNTLVYLFIC